MARYLRKKNICNLKLFINILEVENYFIKGKRGFNLKLFLHSIWNEIKKNECHIKCDEENRNKKEEELKSNPRITSCIITSSVYLCMFTNVLFLNI